jgi:ATP-dependent RNA helicase DDX56/DBP9
MAGEKRKRDQADEPPAATEVVQSEESKKPESESEPARTEEETSFVHLGLDPRLLQAVAQQKFAKPTLVQRKAIPLALNGQDVLAKADCGSGKTAAYVLPLLSSILKRKSVRRLFCRCINSAMY